MRYLRQYRLLPILVLSLLLSACDGNSDSDGDNIEDYIQKAKKQYPPKATAVSDLKTIQAVNYDVTQLRNPFERPKAKKGKRYPNAILQNYALTNLQLVGTLADPDSEKMWAFLSTPDGKIYKIIQGSRVGTNYALVTQINHNEVKFVEEQETDSGIEQQEFTLMLQETKP